MAFGSEPPKFLWGAAFSAHQVEGGNDNSDWWDWEHQRGKIARGETTAVACDHYNRFREDFALAEGLALNTIRLSVSWGRIEPRPGEFDQKELDHYRDVVMDLRARGIEPVVTLHHFVHPRWFHTDGGWLNPRAPETFARFAEVVAKALHPYVSIWITFNEPLVQITEGYLKGGYPPGIKDFTSSVIVYQNMVRAHGLATKVLRANTPPNTTGLPVHGVGLALNMHVFDPANDPKTKKGKEDLEGIAVLERLSGWAFYEAVQNGHLHWNIPPIPNLKGGHLLSVRIPEAVGTLDWVGVNYYTRYLIERDKSNSLGIKWIEPKEGMMHPKGMGRLATEFQKRRLSPIPIVVSENGLADGKDRYREKFIREHIESLREAIRQGTDVRGYWYWSLTDNFEWDKGFEPRFGLIEIDYKTLKRTVRGSAVWYRDYINSHKEGP